jgi:hypothetical protein
MPLNWLRDYPARAEVAQSGKWEVLPCTKVAAGAGAKKEAPTEVGA